MKTGLAVAVLLALSWGAPAMAADKPETCNCKMQMFQQPDCKGTEDKGDVKWEVGDCMDMTTGKKRKAALFRDTDGLVFNGQFRDGCTLINFFTMSNVTCDALQKASPNNTDACCPGGGAQLGVDYVSSNTESNCTNIMFGNKAYFSLKTDCPQGGVRLVVILCIAGSVLLLVGVVAILSMVCKRKKPDNYVPVPAAPQDDLLKDKGEGNQYGSVGL